MIRSLSIAGGLLALTLIALLHGVERPPARSAGAAGPAHAGVPASAAAPDPVAAMLDDLAAWPAAAGQ